MTFQEIRKMAKAMGINTVGMKKADIIRAIQQAEQNIDCYATERVDCCGETCCLWREDCVAGMKSLSSARR